MPSDYASTASTDLSDVRAAAPPSRISWGSVLAGGLIAAAIAATLNILGAAIGATTIDAVARETPTASSLGLLTVVWMVVSNTIAVAIGGYAAARLSGTADDTDAVLHGLAVWAIAFLISAVLVGNILAGLASTATRAVGGAVGGAASAVGEVAKQAVPAVSPQALIDRARNTLRGTGGEPTTMTTEQRGAEIASLLAQRVARGSFAPADRTRLEALVAAEGGIPQAEAARRVQTVETEAQRAATEAEQRAREAADATARAASMTAFGTFGALLLGAFASIFGARRGARHFAPTAIGTVRRSV